MEKYTALILSDDTDMKMFFQKHFPESFFLIEKKYPSEVYAIAETTNLDMIFIDDKIDNPLDLCFQLKKRKRLFTLPIILITENLKKTYKQKAIKAGVFDFLYHPLNEDDFFKILQKCKDEKKRIKKISSLSEKIQNKKFN